MTGRIVYLDRGWFEARRSRRRGFAGEKPFAGKEPSRAKN